MEYAATASAGQSALQDTIALLGTTSTPGAEALRDHFAKRAEHVALYRAAYRRYCWPADTLADYRVAPFHLLAGEGAVYTHRDHRWHIDTLAQLAATDPALLLSTPYRVVDLADPASEAAATAWWEQLTEDGGEGMVVKSLDWITRGKRGLVQPAIKCRGREYLRIIYGPEYLILPHLERLRGRGLAVKRGLALREFALGLEALHRFVERAPLYRVHECVFGVLALESEPVDPRL